MKREKYLGIRMTTREFQEIYKYAKDKKMTVSEWVRSEIFKGKKKIKIERITK